MTALGDHRCLIEIQWPASPAFEIADEADAIRQNFRKLRLCDGTATSSPSRKGGRTLSYRRAPRANHFGFIPKREAVLCHSLTQWSPV
jgi:hypothetical protein